MSLRRAIQEQQALIAEDRLLMSAHGHALGFRVRRGLATPQALAGSFGIGLALGLHRGRARRSADDEPPADHAGGGGRLLHLLIRDLALPLAMHLLAQHGADQTAPEVQE